MKRMFLVVALFAFVSGSVYAQTPGTTSATPAKQDVKKEGPCKKIEEVCQNAGFIKGEAKEGKGLWVDCIDPIMKGTPQPKNAKIALPQVDASIISACKAKHPNFGEGKAKKH